MLMNSLNLQNLLFIVLAIVILMAWLKLKGSLSKATQPSNYSIHINNPINYPSNYPISKENGGEFYHPIAPWTGRLILPQKEQRKAKEFVFFEVHNAPNIYQFLIGQIIELTWQDNPDTQEYVNAVTKDVDFTSVAVESEKAGLVHPFRLNHLKQVGPLESLAGARPQDDMTVILHDPNVIEQHNHYTLQIKEEPVQITGRYYGLVTIIQPETENSDRFQIKHFDKTSKKFIGPTEIICIPQALANRDDVTPSTNHEIEDSPFNSSGWYIYGAKDQSGMFVVQAIEPRALMQLTPDLTLNDLKQQEDYIFEQNWADTKAQKTEGNKILLTSPKQNSQRTASNWQINDQAIVIHLFGGYGPVDKPKKGLFKLVTGHFAYGFAQIIREPLSGELRFDIEYQQIYAQNPNAIISGAIKWFSYMGDLRRGWLGTRPISDVVIKFEPLIQTYGSGTQVVSPILEFKLQLKLMMARYRIGNGTGAAIVSPAQSCVQDSNQALYRAIQEIEEKSEEAPQLRQLAALGIALEQKLSPLGLVRSDWKKNIDTLVGSPPTQSKLLNLIRGLLSWRTLLPRRAHDELAKLFLIHGAQLWFIRANQIGGIDSTIVPYAPTTIIPSR